MSSEKYPDTAEEWLKWDQRMFTCYQYFIRVELWTRHDRTDLFGGVMFNINLHQMMLVSRMFLHGTWGEDSDDRDLITDHYINSFNMQSNPHFITTVFGLMEDVFYFFNECNNLAKEYYPALSFEPRTDTIKGFRSAINRYISAFRELKSSLDIRQTSDDVKFLIEYVIGNKKIDDPERYNTMLRTLSSHPMQWLLDKLIFCDDQRMTNLVFDDVTMDEMTRRKKIQAHEAREGNWSMIRRSTET